MKYSVFIFVLIVLLSCETVKNGCSEIEQVTLKSIEEFGSNDRYLECIDTVFLLPLETKEESLINDISNVVITDKSIVVYDEGNTREPILIFDRMGHYQRSIPYGNGPGELISVQTVNYNIYDSSVIVYELGRFINEYSSDGTFKSQKELSHISDEIIATESGYLLRNYEYLSVRNINNDGYDDKLVLYTDKDFNIKKGWIDRRDGLFGLSAHRYFYNSDNNIIVTSSYNDTIYEYDGEELRPKLVLKYPNKLEEKYLHDDVEEPESYMEFYGEMGDNGTHQFFLFQTGKEDPQIIVIRDKTNGKVIPTFYVDDMYGSVPPILYPRYATSDGLFFLDVYGGNEQVQKTLKPYLSDKDMELLQSMTDEDNPALLFFRLKKF